MIKNKILIIGLGRLGTALAKALIHTKKYDVCVSSQNREKAHIFAKENDCEIISDFKTMLDLSMIFITTPDSAIEKVAHQLSKVCLSENVIVVHMSGVLSKNVLKSLETKTRYIASMHPVQAFPGGEQDWTRFNGITFGVEADDILFDSLNKVAEILGADCIKLDAEQKVMYHAASCVASNYLVALALAAQKLYEKAGIGGSAIDTLYPLMQTTLNNIKSLGPADSISGPIIRGDVETIEKHLAEMEKNVPELVNLYKSLGKVLLNSLADFDERHEKIKETLKLE